ncbi:MAG: HAD family hydrolase [Lachnospiraceae bacterium]|nr:HAD family hydrolase [Lachnospiraceae bacterium]
MDPETHKTEPSLPFPLNLIFRERVRLGTPELMRQLRQEGIELWVYTSSFRKEWYIRTLFRLYHIRFDEVVNGFRHLKEVQGNREKILPSKMPHHYGIHLHVDDEKRVVQYGKIYGFNVYRLEEQDDAWAEKLLEKVRNVKKGYQRRG